MFKLKTNWKKVRLRSRRAAIPRHGKFAYTIPKCQKDLHFLTLEGTLEAVRFMEILKAAGGP
jgi:hypothetical protein